MNNKKKAEESKQGIKTIKLTGNENNKVQKSIDNFFKSKGTIVTTGKIFLIIRLGLAYCIGEPLNCQRRLLNYLRRLL